MTTDLMDAIAWTPAALVLPDLAWTTLLLLGAVHGINPAMGWLFAVSLGLQSGNRSAVLGALAPLALGHAVAIAVTVFAVGVVGLLIPLHVLKWIVAAVLVAAGVAHLTRHRHPRFGGMRVGRRDLAVWSFLVASAHGAGLMAVPFLLERGPTGSADGTPLMAGSHGLTGTLSPAAPGGPVESVVRAANALPVDWVVGLLGSAVHAAGYLAVTALVGVVVYEWVGLRLLRRAWINLDLVWAVALVVTGILTPFV